MNIDIVMKTAVARSVFADELPVPFNVFFGHGASMPRVYPFIDPDLIYTVTEYWMNENGDIMIKFHGLPKFIKFIEGGMYISHFMKPN